MKEMKKTIEGWAIMDKDDNLFLMFPKSDIENEMRLNLPIKGAPHKSVPCLITYTIYKDGKI